MTTGILVTKDYMHFEIHDEETHKCLVSFEGAQKAKGCLPGDIVIYNDSKCTFKESGHHDLLVGTLECSSKTTYGLNARGHFLYLFVPYNRAYPQFIVGSSEKDHSCNRLGIIKYERWDSGSQFPRGSLQQLFGPSGDPKAEEEALRWLAFPWMSLRNKHVDVIVPKQELKWDNKRTRLEGLTFNIDPAGCKDIDDIITIKQEDSDRWTITITIADVARYVEEMSAQDILASTFGQTLYKDGEAICPMLPPSYSEDACSLVPGKERYGVSLQFTWSDKISDIKWFESVFVNSRTFTYEEFQICELPEKSILKAVSSYMEKQEVTDSHKWIESMMKFYNIEAGQLLKNVGAGILRKHSGPITECLDKYVKWDSELAILAQTSAEYCLADSSDSTHYGIGVSAYCHATSPIRRYADLMNQRILKQIIRENKEGLFVTVDIQDLNKRAKLAKSFEKNLLFLRAVLNNERTLTGCRVIDILENKLRIWIPQWKKTVNVRMKQTEDGQFMSADEKDTYKITEGDIINIDFGINLSNSRWKERMIIRVYMPPGVAGPDAH